MNILLWKQIWRSNADHMMNVDHEDWRLPSEVDLTKDLSTCARPGLQDSLSQYSQHIHPTNHSPTTHWLTFKAEIAVSEWVYPVLQWNVNMLIRSQSPDTLVLSSRYDAEAEYYFHQDFMVFLLRRNTWWQLGWWHSCAVETKDSSNPITDQPSSPD